MNICMPDNLLNARTGQPNRAVVLPYNPGPSALSAESNFFQSAFPLKFTAIDAGTVTPNNAQTPVGSEALILVFGREKHAVQVTGSFTATILVEVTLDDPASQNAQWITLDTITAASVKQYTGIYYAMRLSISAYTSGNPRVVVQTKS
jgi:hypothetical protein